MINDRYTQTAIRSTSVASAIAMKSWRFFGAFTLTLCIVAIAPNPASADVEEGNKEAFDKNCSEKGWLKAGTKNEKQPFFNRALQTRVSDIQQQRALGPINLVD